MSQTQGKFSPLVRWLRRVITEPQSELDRWERAIRYCFDVVRVGALQLRHDHAPRMAGALAFRTLFGLLPVLVVSTVLVKAIQGFDQFSTMLSGLMRSAGLYDLTVNVAEEGADSPSEQNLGLLLESLLTDAAGVNLAAVGWVGLGVLIYSAISLMVTVEGCFNSICRAPEGRPWMQRIPVYFTVLLGWPLAFGLISYVDGRFDAVLSTFDATGWVASVAPVIWSYMSIWLVMLAIYMLVPNTRVTIRSALAGAFVATALIELGRWLLGAYLQNAVSLEQHYGSLGLIPLFMFWVYLMWLVVLFGLEVAAILHRVRGKNFQPYEKPPSGVVDPAAIVAVMQVIASRFAAGKPCDEQHLIETTAIEPQTLGVMLERLLEAGLIHRVEDHDGAYTLARPAQNINLAKVIEIGFELADAGVADRQTKDDVIDQLRRAQISHVSSRSLADPSMRTDDSAPSDQANGSS